MAIILATELQRDLEALYKIAGDLLNELEMQEAEKDVKSMQQQLDLVKARLEDIAGTLQKDIYTIRHIIMKNKAGMHGA